MEVLQIHGRVDNILDVNGIIHSFKIQFQESNSHVDIKIDLSKVEFISPYGAIYLLLFFEKFNNRIKQIKLPSEQVLSYLHRMDFFNYIPKEIHCLDDKDLLGKLNKRTRYDRRDILLEISPILNVEDVNNIYNSVLKILKENDISSRERSIVANIVSELTTNIIDHSYGVGFASIQCYSNSKKIVIAIGDNGIGIINAIKSTFLSEFPNRKINDLILLKYAFKQRKSSNLETNRGLGLDNVRESSFKHAENVLFNIITNGSTFNITDEKIKHVVEKDYFPGTYIYLEIKF